MRREGEEMHDTKCAQYVIGKQCGEQQTANSVVWCRRNEESKIRGLQTNK